MTFANPWMLLGLLAGLIPLLVHLFDRRRPRPHPFGAIAFVLRSQKRTASRLKLKRLILYSLRTLILLALPVALARPEWRDEGTSSGSARGPSATAIVIDASLSMRWTDGDSLFRKAQEQAQDALRDLQPEEPATVVVCAPALSPPAPPSFERARLRALIDEAQPSFGAADLNRCLELAARALEDSPLPGKRLVLISDFTQPALRLESPAPTVANAQGEQLRPEVVLRDVARGHAALPNRAIVDLKIEPALQVGPRAFQFTFTVRNHSAEPVKDLEASLKIGDQVVAKGFLDVAAQGTAQKSLTHRFEAGGVVQGEVALTADHLREDDHRPFTLSVPSELRALILNGAPNPIRFRDEAFFVEAALTAPGSPVRASLRDVEAGFKEDLTQYDVVLLLNPHPPSEAQAAALTQFVNQGGGLFLSMGDHLDPEAFNARLQHLLPRPLRLPKTSAAPNDADADIRAARLLTVNTDHPVFSVFTGKAKEGLLSARFYRYMLLEAEQVAAGEKAGSEVLASLDDGAPAIAVAHRGRGRVMLYTSTVDRDWSDFSIRTSFLPLMQRCTAYLAGSLEERHDLVVRIGETVQLRGAGQEDIEVVRGPGEQPLRVQRLPDGSGTVGPIAIPGSYQGVNRAGQGVDTQGFAAVLDASESDLTRIKPELVTSYFGEETVRTADEQGAERKTPLWSWLILTAVAAFFFEGVLLRRT